MKRILIFAGTTEGRRLSECLAAAGISHTVCVATEYGEIVLKHLPEVTVHKGRMNCEEIRSFIEEGEFVVVVDATHPYACEVTENIKTAVEELAASGIRIPYLRLKREMDNGQSYDKITYFDSNESCAEALEKTEGNILLTTGSKELETYSRHEGLKERLYVRVLPGMESIELCMRQGICGKQVLALQGPFSEELNLALLHQYRIRCMVTKRSGISGGYSEKIEAARKADIPVYVIGSPAEDNGYSFREVCDKLSGPCSKEIILRQQMEIVLAGTGMGSTAGLTREVFEAVAEADILLGAERMIEQYQPRIEKKPYCLAVQIIPYLKEIQKKYNLSESCKVVILFSGDSGFYSGCEKLYHKLLKEVNDGAIKASLRILPGISSVACLAAYAGESWQDAAIRSMHGKKTEQWQEIMNAIQHHNRTFLLMSGAEDVGELGRLLIKQKLPLCRVTVGYQLSYPEQEILQLSPEECSHVTKKGLYTCLITNPFFETKRLTHGRADAEFIRDAVPMTKEEVREVSICKLHLREDSVLYDIGSGTGSIAVEAAGLSPRIQVFAIERKKEAAALIEQNRQQFQTWNVQVVEAEAPEGMTSLPMPTHAFIGGSGHRMKEILTELYRKNSSMRVVINAISLETISELQQLLSEYPVTEEEIVQMQVSRTKKAGGYHLMQAENPVWIFSFNFMPEKEEL